MAERASETAAEDVVSVQRKKVMKQAHWFLLIKQETAF